MMKILILLFLVSFNSFASNDSTYQIELFQVEGEKGLIRASNLPIEEVNRALENSNSVTSNINRSVAGSHSENYGNRVVSFSISSLGSKGLASEISESDVKSGSKLLLLEREVSIAFPITETMKIRPSFRTANLDQTLIRSEGNRSFSGDLVGGSLSLEDSTKIVGPLYMGARVGSFYLYGDVDENYENRRYRHIDYGVEVEVGPKIEWNRFVGSVSFHLSRIRTQMHESSFQEDYFIFGGAVSLGFRI